MKVLSIKIFNVKVSPIKIFNMKLYSIPAAAQQQTCYLSLAVLLRHLALAAPRVFLLRTPAIRLQLHTHTDSFATCVWVCLRVYVCVYVCAYVCVCVSCAPAV